MGVLSSMPCRLPMCYPNGWWSDLCLGLLLDDRPPLVEPLPNPVVDPPLVPATDPPGWPVRPVDPDIDRVFAPL
jgi:hypothetical protein